MRVTGACRGNLGPNQGAPFSRPVYDSGWSYSNQGQTKTFTHNLGGAVDGCVIDMMIKDTDVGGLGINNMNNSHWESSQLPDHGVYSSRVTTSQISVRRGLDDTKSDHLRLRIWVIQ